MRNTKTIGIYLMSIFLLIICLMLSLAFGSKNVGFSQAINALINSDDMSFSAIVVRERIPRTIFSVMAGASLGISGALMQSITRNPIADPSILGVNTGASLFVVIGIAFFNINSANEYIWIALAGAGITSIFVYGIASMGSGGMTPIKLALAGSATSAVLTSLVSVIILPRSEVMNAYRFWQVGSVSGATWDSINLILPYLIIGLIISIISTPALDVLALGDEVATGLGVNIGIIRIICAIAGVILCGAITAIAGPIGFVGLMIPHSIRLILGANLRGLVPMSAIGGAVLLTISDVLGRVIGSPGELQVGIITAFFGAPILIIIARKAKVRAI
ncbi:iron complex transport system permease protein [Clostridium saccharoperbutylacetonicum]|uniref:Ferric enterobactin transport system permease protein FepD n=1 Tax=Clostridium saccharoperbutylacetonicum N1-4(HMT) TaxID=931276 RepID=M1MV64_9CLOT|nr:iron ABC transporter permease [Clostridium saccharoperbutylacetonicum]AGF58546.1 ferric enterobactin transport system permease protein FepD [Clostridium saccharoperbutylacetonicum N1-4(HMT)]NRT60676.1 iron complex transport system permease protein [Clostridium saccharoperbutylacetonicum]NSB23990.1 iron complex transport system permease protein [Clostridium saccharoperbutylacetonicum]NSB43366.1 iron complex transport system permease protein [Clostridium saccharoperbutylacetonicum]